MPQNPYLSIFVQGIMIEEQVNLQNYPFMLTVTSRTAEGRVWLLVEHCRRRTDPQNPRYIELATCISGILFVYLIEKNRFHEGCVYAFSEGKHFEERLCRVRIPFCEILLLDKIIIVNIRCQKKQRHACVVKLIFGETSNNCPQYTGG